MYDFKKKLDKKWTLNEQRNYEIQIDNSLSHIVIRI
jgi:hypothetical protein